MSRRGPIHVMVIEDEEWLANHYMRIFESAGWMVSWAANATDGIEVLDRKLPDVLILDLFMPGSNAVALLNEMRSYKDLRAIPVILCTNSAPELDRKALRPYGVRTVLDKATMRPDDLVRSVRSVVLT